MIKRKHKLSKKERLRLKEIIILRKRYLRNNNLPDPFKSLLNMINYRYFHYLINKILRTQYKTFKLEPQEKIIDIKSYKKNICIEVDLNKYDDLTFINRYSEFVRNS